MLNNAITAVTGFNPTPTGGYFGFLPGETPALLRGGTGSFLWSALIAMPSLREDTSSEGVVLGCSSLIGQNGWSLNGEFDEVEYTVDIGTDNMGVEGATPMNSHAHLVVNCVNGGAGALEASMFLNGILIAAIAAGDWVAPGAGVEFCIGNSQEDTTLFAMRDVGVAAFGMGPAMPMTTEGEVQALMDAVASMWHTTERAGDLIDLEGLFTYAWSARRSLTNVVDGGNETWVDWKAGEILHRLGTQAGTSVTARQAQWAAGVVP
jgi:hypothetical protein